MLFFILGYLVPGPKPWTTREMLACVVFPVLCVWAPAEARFLDRFIDPRSRRYPVWVFRWFGWAVLVGGNVVHQLQRWAGP